MEDKTPQGGGAKLPPLGAAPKAPPCLPFGKDFLCFWCIFGALLDLHGPTGMFILNFRDFFYGSLVAIVVSAD